MSPTVRGLIVWGVAFFALEFAAIFWAGCPWPTFTGTIRGAVYWWHPLATLVAVIAMLLVLHFDDGMSARPLIAAAVLGVTAVIVHTLLR